MKKISVVFLLLIEVALAACLEAQQRDPRTFFPQGFVEGGVTRGQTHHAPALVGPSQDESILQAQDKDAEMHEHYQAGLNASVLVNSGDKEHFDAVYQKLLTLHRRGRMRIVLVEYMGSYQNISDSQRDELMQDGIMVMPTKTLPTDVVVKTSPTWRISKGNNTFIVEGFYAPERFFTASGDFVPPIGMEVQGVVDDRADAQLKDF